MTYYLTVDGRLYDWPRRAIRGSELYGIVPGLNPAFCILREADPDVVVLPEDVFLLVSDRRQKVPAFYTAPPATFGVGAAG